MMKGRPENLGLQTRVLHEADSLNETSAVTAPIWQTTTFSALTPEELAEDEKDLIADFAQALEEL
jgi:O-acetylhomoserine/O-acetylserine sulfhydrylase-like pyridoxal-dependent enzyme